jgi:outer membrane receptor for ferric coprogen and ferric-rhodotorulic acid
VATGYELGVRARPFRGLDVAATAWALDLASEVVWVGDEGTTEARPATVRRGVEAEIRYALTSWLRADVDFTYTSARFVEETGGGTRVTLAPVLTWAGGMSADSPIGIFGSVRVQGLSDRPANEDSSLVAQGFTLVDLQLGYKTSRFKGALNVRNLLNSPWRQAQFANQSRLQSEAQPVDDVHFTAGAPLNVSLAVTVFL